MRDSSAYQAILEEGRVEGARQLLLDLGTERLGPPDTVTEATLRSITDFDHLKRLTKRSLSVNTSEELLQVP